MSGGGMMANFSCFSFISVSTNPHCCVRLLSVFGFVFLQPAQSKPVVGPPAQIQRPLFLFWDSLNFMQHLPWSILHMKRELMLTDIMPTSVALRLLCIPSSGLTFLHPATGGKRKNSRSKHSELVFTSCKFDRYYLQP